MRKKHNDILDNAIASMNNNNKNYVRQEIDRTAGNQQRSTEYRRDGMLNFGALQMKNFIGDSRFLVVGSSNANLIVGR